MVDMEYKIMCNDKNVISEVPPYTRYPSTFDAFSAMWKHEREHPDWEVWIVGVLPGDEPGSERRVPSPKEMSIAMWDRKITLGY